MSQTPPHVAIRGKFRLLLRKRSSCTRLGPIIISFASDQVLRRGINPSLGLIPQRALIDTSELRWIYWYKIILSRFGDLVYFAFALKRIWKPTAIISHAFMSFSDIPAPYYGRNGIIFPTPKPRRSGDCRIYDELSKSENRYYYTGWSAYKNKIKKTRRTYHQQIRSHHFLGYTRISIYIRNVRTRTFPTFDLLFWNFNTGSGHCRVARTCIHSKCELNTRGHITIWHWF